MGILPLAFGHVIINGTLQKSSVLLVPGGASHQHWRPSEQDPLLLAFRLFPPGGWAPKGHFNHLQSTCFFFREHAWIRWILDSTHLIKICGSKSWYRVVSSHRNSHSVQLEASFPEDVKSWQQSSMRISDCMAHGGNARQFDHGIAISHELWPEYFIRHPCLGVSEIGYSKIQWLIIIVPWKTHQNWHWGYQKESDIIKHTHVIFSHSATMKYHYVYSYNLSPSFIFESPFCLMKWSISCSPKYHIIAYIPNRLYVHCSWLRLQLFLVRPPWCPPKQKKQLTEENRPVLAVEPGRTCPHQPWQLPGRLSAGPEGPWVGADAPWRGVSSYGHLL